MDQDVAFIDQGLVEKIAAQQEPLTDLEVKTVAIILLMYERHLLHEANRIASVFNRMRFDGLDIDHLSFEHSLRDPANAEGVVRARQYLDALVREIPHDNKIIDFLAEKRQRQEEDKT